MKRTFVSTAALALTGLGLAGCLIAPPAAEQGRIFYDSGNYLSAADAYTEDIRLHPRSAAAWNNRAVARVRLGDLNGAIRDYNRAVELAPDDAEISFNRGNALVAAGQYREAILDYDRAITLMPTYARAIFNRGTAYSLAGQPDAARRDWLAAIALEPDPYSKSAMRRSAGLDTAATVVASAAPAGQPTTATTIAPAPPVGVRPGMPPLPAAPATAAFPNVAASQPAASPIEIDARALTSRAISRELDGDHAGALQDLNAALALEPDAARREAIARLIRLLEMPR
jgi:regulator of sirC expression with transglutaminase-like and TPR domain